MKLMKLAIWLVVLKFFVLIVSLVGWGYIFWLNWKLGLAMFLIFWANNISQNTDL